MVRAATTPHGRAPGLPRGSEDRPEVEKPVPPDAMARDDVAGAEAAAQYFLELYPYVYATGDLAEWKAMSDPECVFCQSVVDNVEELYSGGGFGVGPEIEIRTVDGSPPREGNEYFAVWIDVGEGKSSIFDAQGVQTASSDGGPAAFDFAIKRSEGRWVIGEASFEREAG
ncbi:DUF6318 family protein [Georgenia sp. SUBG003]|uniref:DUF6318 family protein n=1 Tax=Georgenia sp. SUBG003 TaxID=1497974 RepID=UPI003AB59E6D